VAAQQRVNSICWNIEFVLKHLHQFNIYFFSLTCLQ
jgi:hypothetical protein